jgi:prepilin-type N-terminal cleavage/methylation domain-containing protein
MSDHLSQLGRAFTLIEQRRGFTLIERRTEFIPFSAGSERNEFCSTKRRGFTLIELLVVIAIIGMLIALLLPAVQKVREAANRTRCQNNLKQIALAVHGYHDVHNLFPANGSKFNLANSGTGTMSTSWSFLARSLPFLEQGNLHREGNVDTASLLGNTLTGVTLPVFLCPSDPKDPALNNNRANDWITGKPIGLTNYKGVSGSNWCWGDFPFAGTNGSCDVFYQGGTGRGDGIFYRTDIIHPIDISRLTDGASNTFMIGEDVPEFNGWAAWPYANTAVGTCGIPPNINLDAKYGKANGENGAWTNTFSFRSRHPGGLQFACADGSVRFIMQSMPLATYRALASIQGGEVVSSD